MMAAELKEHIVSVLDNLPEAKLAAVLDFAQFLAEREQQMAWLEAQSRSATYQDWLSDENDIYDEVFADVTQAR